VHALTSAERPRGVLALGAHPDDVEIGCGGTLMRLLQRWPDLPVTVVVLTGSPQRQDEARAACELFLAGRGVVPWTFTLPDGRLPCVWGDVKAHLEDVAAQVDVDVVLAPRADDAHQDHRTVARIAPTVWRDQLLLGYEIPKYDGNLGPATLYVPLDEQLVLEKARLLAKAFPSQTGRDWWDEETFLGLARLRGVECRTRYAEAFALTKASLQW
jgi:LmbE family N-acetylglucosaminyl deacetylase